MLAPYCAPPGLKNNRYAWFPGALPQAMLFRPFGAPELTQEPTQSSPAVSKDRLVKSVVRRQRVFMTEAPNDLSLEELARRKAWFNEYTARLDGGPPALPLRCPSCGCKTLCER